MTNSTKTHVDLGALIDIMARLRDPDSGCPWDLEQTFASIAPHTIEEAYEVADAIHREAWDELKSELGDCIFQVVFLCHLADENGYFNITDVIQNICDKMMHRHPHVFGHESNDKTAAQQVQDWENIKQQERGSQSILANVTLGLPALLRAVKLQKRAARVGFDWPSYQSVIDKLHEETHEVIDAIAQGNNDHITEEIGDLLFVVSNLARHFDIDPEAALRQANNKFIRRFTYIEAALSAAGKTPAQSNLTEMEALWAEVKNQEKS